MRAIGTLQPEASARTFSDYLYVQGIDNHFEPEENGAWTIWVHAEDQLDQAKEMLGTFRTNPSDSRYLTEAKGADGLREERERAEQAYAARVKDRRTLVRGLAGFGFGRVTLALIIICAAVFLLSGSGRNTSVVAPLLISEYAPEGSGFLERLGSMVEVRHGQVWRLLTPVLIHFGVLHILFNMLWLRDLGSMIESRFGPRYLISFIVAVALFSNVAQYVVKGPIFGGMSGVVYGLFGFIWIRGRTDPNSGLFLHPTTVTMMIIWFFLCFTGLVGNIANIVHTTGLGIGMFWGWLSGSRRF
jgi:GlpG protein